MTVKELAQELIQYWDMGHGDKPVLIMDLPAGKVIPLAEDGTEAENTNELTEVMIDNG